MIFYTSATDLGWGTNVAAKVKFSVIFNGLTTFISWKHKIKIVLQNRNTNIVKLKGKQGDCSWQRVWGASLVYLACPAGKVASINIYVRVSPPEWPDEIWVIHLTTARSEQNAADPESVSPRTWSAVNRSSPKAASLKRYVTLAGRH